MHMGTYVPYFKKRPELIKKFKLPNPAPRSWRRRAGQQDEELRQQLSTDYKFPLVHSGNTVRLLLIPSKPASLPGLTATLKIPPDYQSAGGMLCGGALPGRQGRYSPCFVGDLPPQLAALNRTNINVHELAVRGIAEKDKTKLFQAALLDPLTAAILTMTKSGKWWTNCSRQTSSI